MLMLVMMTDMLIGVCGVQVSQVEILKPVFASEEVAIFQPQDCQCHRNRVLFGSLISVGGGR